MIAPNKHRGWLHVLALVFPYLIIVGLFQVLGLYLAGVDFSDTGMSKSPLQTLIIKACDLVGTLLLLWVFMRYVDKLKFIK